jgi:cytidine deaminase
MTGSHGDLVAAACQARLASYSPYSRFRVGAALRGESGRIFTGTNVENASLGLSICAERAALFRGVSDGEQRFSAIAICADGQKPTPPCGACRQVLSEFGLAMDVVVVGEEGEGGRVLRLQLSDLLAHPFLTFNPDTG